jgi:hypothetical protein
MIQWCLEYPLLAFILAIVLFCQVRKILVGVFGNCSCHEEHKCCMSCYNDDTDLD